MTRFNRNFLLALKVLLPLVMLCWTGAVSAQVLSWNYENILTDLQQSGGNPSVHLDDIGNIHVSYWQKRQSKLVYGMRDKSTGVWAFTTIDDTGEYGFKSSLTLDNNGFVHIVYLKRQGEDAWLHYATNKSGSWTTELLFANSDLGPYDEGSTFPRFMHHSLDLKLQDNGKPIVQFFNGKIYNVIACGPLGRIDSSYSFYELNLNILAQEPNDSWTYYSVPTPDFNESFGCLPAGDRFGEFSHLINAGSGQFYSIGNALHNGKAMFGRSGIADLNTWNFYAVDSLRRAYNSNPSDNLFWEGFDGIRYAQSEDSVINMIYITSRLYGKLNSNDILKRFFFASFHPDSLGSPTYTPFYREITARDGYKNHFDITTSSPDSIYIAYQYANSGAVIFSASDDAGLTWNPDTMFVTSVSADMQLNHFEDSLFLMVYHEDLDYLSLSRRSVSNPTWITENATVTEERANNFSSQIERNGNDDEIMIAFDEALAGSVTYGERIGGTWSYENLIAASEGVQGVAVNKLANGEPIVAYGLKNANELRVFYRDNGSWTNTLVESGVSVEDIALERYNNEIHICYYVINEAEVRHAKADMIGGTWTIEVVDNSSPIIGQGVDLEIDPNGKLHMVYLDIFNAGLRYATLPVGGTWSLSNVTNNFDYNPAFPQLELRSDLVPVVAFRDAGTNTIYVSNFDGNDWSETTVAGDITNLVGAPLKLILDDKDRPWVMYNYITATDELRLVRQDGQGNWNQVSVSNNFRQIANTFDFHLVGEDFYVLGKQNRVDNNGIGMLFAQNGVNTSLESLLAENSLQVYPNPLRDGLLHIDFELLEARNMRATLYNLQGKAVHFREETSILSAGLHQWEWAIGSLPPGLYLLELQSGDQRLSRKIMIQP